MKANELRIGNLVQSIISNFKLKVTGTVGERVFYDGEPTSGVRPDYEIEGIPLTEEWLVKFNFQYCDSKITGNGQKLTIQITNTEYLDFEDNEFFISNVNDNRVVTFWQEIKYVHQLQNLYFGITGEDLMINE